MGNNSRFRVLIYGRPVREMDALCAIREFVLIKNYCCAKSPMGRP
jgi:hypothetical protein